MAWAPDYTDLTKLKAHLRITDSADDTALSAVISSASRTIDYACNRQFGSVTPAVARVYSQDCGLLIEGRPAVAIDDLMSTTNLVVALDMDDSGGYATTLTLGTDFELWPYNAAADGKPWTHLVMKASSSHYLPWTTRGVRVTALFGWLTVPAVVANAALIQAARFFVRRDSAYGVAGSPALGSELRLLDRLDPDVDLMVHTVKRHWAAV